MRRGTNPLHGPWVSKGSHGLWLLSWIRSVVRVQFLKAACDDNCMLHCWAAAFQIQDTFKGAGLDHCPMFATEFGAHSRVVSMDAELWKVAGLNGTCAFRPRILGSSQRWSQEFGIFWDVFGMIPEFWDFFGAIPSHPRYLKTSQKDWEFLEYITWHPKNIPGNPKKIPRFWGKSQNFGM